MLFRPLLILFLIWLPGSAAAADAFAQAPRSFPSIATIDHRMRDGTLALYPLNRAHWETRFYDEPGGRFFELWNRIGYEPAVPAAERTRDWAQRFGAAGIHVESGVRQASQILPLIVAAIYSPRPTGSATARMSPSFGVTLGEYADRTGADPAQFESFVESARRIIAGGTTAKRTVADTSRWLLATAAAVQQAVASAEAEIGARRDAAFDAAMTDLRVLAQLARFHGHRAIGAVRFNLYKRSLKLAELVASVYDEKESLEAWRALAAIADRAPGHPLAEAWRAELKLLTASFQELEEQCCPPDEATKRQVVWHPAPSGDGETPQVAHNRVRQAAARRPFRIAARITDPAGIASVRVWHRDARKVDATAMPMTPTGNPDEFAATLPAALFPANGSVVYYIEVIDRSGKGTLWPDLAEDVPYIPITVVPE